MLNKGLYDLTQQVQGAIFQSAFQTYQASLDEEAKANQPTPHPLMQVKRGYAESPAWMMVQAREFDPEPMTVEKLVIRATYSAPRILRAILDLMTSEGWLDRIGEHYTLTESGREVAHKMVSRTRTIVACFDAVPTSDLDRLAQLLGAILDASMTHQDIPSVWCLLYSRRRAEPNTTAVEKIIEYCSEMNALRDDAHMSAFGKYNIIGYTWEAFSFVDDGNAKNAQDLFDQLGYRGLSRAEWQDSLDPLVMRGWLKREDGNYITTERGKSVRKDVEALTDHYFYAPWSCLKDGEITELRELMTHVIETSTQ